MLSIKRYRTLELINFYAHLSNLITRVRTYVHTLNEKSDAIYDTVRGPSYGTTRIGTIMRNFCY